MNSEMVKSGIAVLTEREKVDGTIVGERERETDVVWTRVRYSPATTETSLIDFIDEAGLRVPQLRMVPLAGYSTCPRGATASASSATARPG
jgi:hypothetical protein